MSIKILLADDHKIFLQGLCSLLQDQPDMKVVAEAHNGREAVKLARTLLPDVVIMDIAMADLNGFEATRQILSEVSDVKVVALSMHSDRRFVREMLQAGALGYVLKCAALEELVTAIRAVLAKQMYLSPGISSGVVKEYLQFVAEANSGKASLLTPREREVLQLLAEGKTTREIGRLLYVSIKTVETHRKRIMDKLELRSVAELTKFAVREGLTSLDD